MIEKLSLLPYFLQGLLCASSRTSDFVLVGLLCWLAGLFCGGLLVLLATSRAARSIVWRCVGVILQEVQPTVPDRLARYRAVDGR